MLEMTQTEYDNAQRDTRKIIIKSFRNVYIHGFEFR